MKSVWLLAFPCIGTIVIRLSSSIGKGKFRLCKPYSAKYIYLQTVMFLNLFNFLFPFLNPTSALLSLPSYICFNRTKTFVVTIHVH